MYDWLVILIHNVQCLFIHVHVMMLMTSWLSDAKFWNFLINIIGYFMTIRFLDKWHGLTQLSHQIFLIFEVMLTLEMLSVRGQQHSFSTHERVFMWKWKCQRFWDRKCLDLGGGGLEPPAFGFMPNALTYWVIRAIHLLSRVFEHWLWRCRYFCMYSYNNVCT